MWLTSDNMNAAKGDLFHGFQLLSRAHNGNRPGKRTAAPHVAVGTGAGPLGFLFEELTRREMADDKRQRAPQDAARINVTEDDEVQYWAKELGVSKERLQELVKEHGVSTDAVRKALGKKQHA